MELWIISQDKEALVKVNMGIMYWEDVNKRNCIVNKDNATGYSILGAYQTRQRALEVLDEIQRLMIASLVDKNLDGYGVVIYEMPIE
jgi:hypothetical protein